MPNITQDARKIAQILQNARVIAVVGHSDRPDRDSYRIANYLRARGYRVYPVNPSVAEIDGYRSYPLLSKLPERVDIVNVFRAPQHLPRIVDDAAAIDAPVVWGQFGVVHPEAEAKAKAHGIDLVMDRCIKVEYAQLVTAVR